MVKPLTIRPCEAADLEAVVDLSLRAWAPNFVSLREVMEQEVFARLHPPGGRWQVRQEHDVRETCASHPVWVADVGGSVAGFVAVDVESNPVEGEIVMLAVDPTFQRQGVGSALFEHGVETVREAGLPIVTVGTGGDPGHAPARATYEKAGLTPVPIARYFKAL